jgi:hypothetical protein
MDIELWIRNKETGSGFRTKISRKKMFLNDNWSRIGVN